MYTLENIFDIKGKKILITGGYGYLGSEISKALIDLEAVVYILGRDEEKAIKFINSLGRRANIKFFSCDVNNNDSVEQTITKIFDESGQIDVLINNASFGKTGKIENITQDDWENGIDGTINNYFRCTKQGLKILKKPGGKIINIASMYGMVSPDPGIYGNTGYDNPPNYGAGKAAIIQFTKYLAVHLANVGINVNSISPGPFPSPTVQESKEFIERLNRKVPLNRIGMPNELIGAVILLASQASSYINGHNLVVDGGWTIW